MNYESVHRWGRAPWALLLVFTPSPFGSSHPDLTQQSDAPPPFIRNPNVQPDTRQYRQNNEHIREVILSANINNAYLTKGLINYKPVEFLVDTGASLISIPHRIADRLGLQPTGRKGEAQTANGTVQIYETTLERLDIGEIYFEHISAFINMGDKSEQILLGMSVLKKLEIVQKGGQLLLRQRGR